ncbi:MAG: GAF domain-containing protein [Candidatus Zapsychrus exili]|nr:GAF domain-containing protein [Candidatus Zapsychrus exili]
MEEKIINKLNVSQGQENKVLRSVVEITNSELDLNLILKEVVKVVSDMTKGDSVFIYLFDEKKRNLILMASKTPHKKDLGKISLKVGEGITGWVARNIKPVAISNKAYKDERFKGLDVLPEDKYEAFLSFPILNKREAVGVINVQHKKSHEYSERTVNLISLVSRQIGCSIENARLYEETKKKALQFDSLVKVSQSITSENYLDEILNLIVVVTAEMLNSRICSIMLLDKKGNELVIKATQSLSEEYTLKPNLKVNNSLSGKVVTTKKPVMIYDVRKEKNYRFRDLAIKENLTSMLCVPMVVKDKAVGLITIYTKEPHSFIKEEVDILQMVANQAAVAIENTKLLDDALKAKDALEARKLIERAKSVLMSSNNLDENTAYNLIHKKSMDSRRSMKEVAESILLVIDLKKEKNF